MQSVFALWYRLDPETTEYVRVNHSVVKKKWEWKKFSYSEVKNVTRYLLPIIHHTQDLKIKN